LHFEEEIGNGHLGTCSQTHLLLHLIEGKHWTVYPPLPLTHQPVHSFNWIHFCISVRHKNYVEFVFMNTHTKNSVFSKVNVLVVKHLLLWIRIYRSKDSPDRLRQKHSH
jgi:hypothetical protein